VGKDDWFRPRLLELLGQRGYRARDMGPGTASLHGVDVLVQVPSIAPSGRSGEGAVGLTSAGITFSALALGNVGRVVVVSRIGAARGTGSYLSRLRELEARAARATSKLTIIRLAHPFGSADDPGPLATAAARSTQEIDADQDDVMVQPVYVDDAREVVLAAVDGRIGDGLIELGGPETMTFREFAKLAASMLPTDGRRTRRPLLRRHRDHAGMRELLADDSVAARKFAAPVATELRSLGEVWGDSDGA
jgi:hypothetical protein